VWPTGADEEAEELMHLVDLIVWARSELREARQWELADGIRDRLSRMGIILEDGPGETSWRKD
jgi:cysteinyl-tRNA synthetase